MIKFFRKKAGALARTVLSPRTIRTLRRPAVLPAYYRNMAKDIEAIIDLQQRPEWHDDEYWAAMLRKYAHIVDKGLWACNFEPGRGVEFRDAAIEAYKNIRSDSMRNDPSVKWAKKKIEQYETAQQKNVGCYNTLDGTGSKSTVKYNELTSLIHSRRSIRSFKEKQVSCEDLEKIFALAPWAASSCNKQTVRIFATNNPEKAAECLQTCKGGTCFSQYVPVFLTFTADLRPYVMPSEACLPQIDTSLAAQNCALAATSLGMSMTILSWSQHDENESRKLRELLRINDYYQIIFNAVVGYPDTCVETPERKGLEFTYTLHT